MTMCTVIVTTLKNILTLPPLVQHKIVARMKGYMLCKCWSSANKHGRIDDRHRPLSFASKGNKRKQTQIEKDIYFFIKLLECNIVVCINF